MYKTRKHFKVTSSENNGIYWRRVELTDLPKLKKMINKESNELFGVFDIARIITNNPLSLCQINPNGKITVFMSLSDRPNVSCIASDNWTEWLNYFYDLKNIELNNTMFIHVLLYRCVDSLINLPVLLEMVYVQIPETKTIILIKPPGTKICAEMCLPFFTLSAKSVFIDPEFGCPEILYHIREFCINKINLRIAEVDDFIDLRAYLRHRLDFLDNYYGQYSLAKILEFPGEDRINLVPNVKVNGLVTIYTNLDYPFMDNVFDLYQYTGLIEFKDEKKRVTEPKIILRLATDLSRMMKKANNSNIQSEIATNFQYEFISNQFKQLTDKPMKPMKQFFQSNILQKDSDTFSVEQESPLKQDLSSTSGSEKNMAFFKEIHNTENKNIIKDFLKFQDKESKQANEMSYYVSSSYYDSSDNMNYTKIDYKRTAFTIELMLIDLNEENKATWDYLISIFIYFTEFPQYEYCLMNLLTIATPPELKKFFCNANLKPNRTYPMGLYILHRSFLTGKFSCVFVTKEHLELMELMIENHPLKHIISNNISKSVFEDTRYRTYIFQCNDQPIGYCVIRLNDEIKFLNSYFDVACYAYPKLARNHMAILLNMDVQRTFIKKSRGLLKLVMEDSDINCLFYKLYTDLTIMEECELSYITEIKELIPVKPRIRIQYDHENVSGDHDKFALFHINTRLCSTQTMSIDAKIVVVGASVVALSFLESLLFNPFSYYIRFSDIVLISDCGTPYQLTLTDLEDQMIPKVAHFNKEYMISMGFNSFVDVITGTVTAINKADKCVTVNEDEKIYYDYLFLFYGEQFGYTAEENEIKNSIESISDENNILENLFLLNSELDVTYAYKYIELIKNNEKDIIVLGKYLGSLTVINVLLESNIDGSRIVYVETYAKENIPFIVNKFIRNAVYNELKKQGVRVYKKCVFEKFTLNGDRTRIRKVTFTSNDAQIAIDCAALFWFDQKLISKVNWFTMLQSALKFDGHLVVNTSFETNIEFVYAAGPMARFMHNEYFIVSQHMYYNRLEIGVRVANVLMKRLGIVEDCKSNDEYVRPLFVYCQLPGKYNYLHAEVPVLRYPKTDTRKTTISTGNATDGYFEILVDTNGDVVALSCYSNKDIKYSNLINLCGKHVNLFNDMMYRFKTNSIPCLFDYFNQPWSYPLYSEKFWKLLDETKLKRDNKFIKKFLCFDDVATLMSDLKVNTISRLSRSTYFDRRFDQLYGEKINTILMNFIANNVDDFPMFSHIIDQRKTEDEYNTV